MLVKQFDKMIRRVQVTLSGGEKICIRTTQYLEQSITAYEIYIFDVLRRLCRMCTLAVRIWQCITHK